MILAILITIFSPVSVLSDASTMLFNFHQIQIFFSRLCAAVVRIVSYTNCLWRSASTRIKFREGQVLEFRIL